MTQKISRCPRCGDAGPNIQDHDTWAGCLCGWIEQRSEVLDYVRQHGELPPDPHDLSIDPLGTMFNRIFSGD